MSAKNARTRRNRKSQAKNKQPDAVDEDLVRNPAIGTYVTRARALRDSGQTDAAMRVFKQAVGLAPANAKLRFEYGRMLVKNRRFGDGTTELETALSLDSGFVAALTELGQAYIGNNQLDKAAPLLEDALARQPKNPGLNLVYGSLKQKQAKLPEAIDYFREALALRLEHPTVDKTPASKTDFGGDIVERLLWDTLSQLARAGVHAFACYGTLLGRVRDGALMPFDKDIDLGIPHCEMERARRCLQDNGWVGIPIMGLTNPEAFVHPLHNVSIDVSGFVVDPADQTTYTGFWIDGVPLKWLRHTRYPPVKLEKGKSPTGQPIWSLSNPEDWLDAIYGDDWRTPDPTFDTVIAAKNLCSFSLLTQCYALSRLYQKWDGGNLARALALADHALRHMPADTLLQSIREQISINTSTPSSTHQPRVRQPSAYDASEFIAPTSAFDNAFEKANLDFNIGYLKT